MDWKLERFPFDARRPRSLSQEAAGWAPSRCHAAKPPLGCSGSLTKTQQDLVDWPLPEFTVKAIQPLGITLGWPMFSRTNPLRVALLGLAVAVSPMVVNQSTFLAAPTSCSSIYDNAVQWTAVSSAFYHPGTGCFGDNAYFGWVGIDGAIKTPAHFPNIYNDTSNHSNGWMEMMFTNPAGWIQIGWLGGCLINGTTYTCGDPPNIVLYDESVSTATYPPTVVVSADGNLAFSATDTYRVEYYPQYSNWEIFDQYNNLIRTIYFSWVSGAPTIAGEVCNCNQPPPIQEIEMPVTVFGSSNPYTNSGLRIKGANGYVPWTSSLSSYTTSWYDERYCPNDNCPSPAVPYYASLFYSNYEFEAYGNTT